MAEMSLADLGLDQVRNFAPPLPEGDLAGGLMGLGRGLKAIGQGVAQTVAVPGQLMAPNPWPEGSEQWQWYEDQKSAAAMQWAPEMALSTMGTGGIVGVPVKGAEAVLGAGPVRRNQVMYKAMEGDIPRMEPETGLTHVAVNPDIAKQFSGGGKRPVREVYVKSNKPFDYRDPADLAWLSKEMEKPENVAAYNRDTKKIMGEGYDHEADARYIQAGLQDGAYQAYEVPAVSNLIRSKGYDGIYMIEDFQRGEPNLALFDPKQIIHRK